MSLFASLVPFGCRVALISHVADCANAAFAVLRAVLSFRWLPCRCLRFAVAVARSCCWIAVLRLFRSLRSVRFVRAAFTGTVVSFAGLLLIVDSVYLPRGVRVRCRCSLCALFPDLCVNVLRC